MSKTAYMRGLQVFISDIRGCQNKEQEQRRVDKELAKIRAKFGEDKPLSGYDRRKYIWKLLYIYMLGYEIDFGHKQACDLIQLPKYSDKQVGYMACSLLLHENDEFLRLAINGIHHDLISRNEAFQCLALSFVGNVGGVEMAEALTQDVLKLLTSGSSRPIVKKRASLCLLRLLRKTAPDASAVSADTFSPVMGGLLEEQNLGLLLCATTLLWGIISRCGPAGYETCQSRVIKILDSLVNRRERVPLEYLYYQIPSPWLQVRCLRTLQHFPPPDSLTDRKLLGELLQTIITNVSAEVAKNANPNKGNALNAILFEAVALALALGGGPDGDANMLSACVAILGRAIQGKDPNAKYLALEALSRLVSGGQSDTLLAACRAHSEVVMASLKDPDVSIRKRAMDLAFTMCDSTTATEVVSSLQSYLVVADLSMREELVLKVAILAEKYAPTMNWYVDVMLQLLERSGDFVGDDIWHRLVQLVTNNDAMQPYAARHVAEALKRGAAHESLICTAAYVLGEYGRLIRADVPPAEQYRLLYNVFPAASQPTKALLLTALLKVYLLEPTNESLKREALGLFERYRRIMDPELQQRAAEYLALANSPQGAAANYVLPMPKWEVRESVLLRRLMKQEGVEEDGAAGGGAVSGIQATEGSGQITSPVLTVPAPGSVATAASGPAAPPDLLSLDSSPPPATLSAQASATAAAAGPTQPPKPANAIDLLSDLFTDTVTVAPAAAPAPAAPAPTAPVAAAPAVAPAAPVVAQHPYNTPFAAGALPAATAAAGVPSAAFPAAVPATAVVPPSSNPFAAAAAAIPPPVVMSTAGGSVPMPAPAAPAATPAAYVPQVTAPPAAVPAAAAASPWATSAFAAMPAAAAAAVPMAPVAAPALEAPRATGDLDGWYNALLFKERGILYEDQYLQVGLQSRYAKGTGELVLFWGNKHAELAITNVVCAIEPSPGLSVVPGPLPAALAPKQQVQVAFSLTCTGPFTEPPRLSLGYALGGQPLPGLPAALKLPLALHKFVAPEPTINKEFFFEQWKAWQAPPHKAQEMVERTSPLSSAAVVGLMRSLHLGVEHSYLDPSPHNEAGAGYLGYSPVPGAAQQSVLCACRIEANPINRQQFRVTVVSPLPALAVSVHRLLVAQIRNAASA